MPNPSAAELIAKHLATGLPHPGNPEAGQPPTLIPLPGFKTTAMPDELAKHINATAQLLGEAVVNVIETEGDLALISKAELERLRTAVQPAGDEPQTTVRCSICGNPLFTINLNRAQPHINGPHFIERIRALSPDCDSKHWPAGS